MGRKATHGETKTRLYQTWRDMRARCSKPYVKSYKDYGGKGISVCEEWENSYESFRDWALSTGYDDTLTIERIDVNKNYEPSNCRWIPIGDQWKTRSDTKWITLFGETKTLYGWINSGRSAVGQRSTFTRIKAGWTDEEALLTPRGFLPISRII